jgi:hypothetical protein
MNERFKELAELCYEVNPLMVENSQKIGNDGVPLYREVFNQEKFAKLIVRECINKITTYDLVPGHSAKWEDIYDIHARLLQDLAEDLKEHFGIEE